MRRAVVLLCVLALTACSGGDEEIAGVGGSTVLLSDIEALFQIAAVPGEDFRQVLFTYLAIEAITQALEADFGAAADQAVIDERVALFEAEMESRGATAAELFGIANASTAVIELQARGWGLRTAAEAALIVDPGVVDRLFADPAVLTTVCVKHILVASEEQAAAVQTRLEAGEDFAAVADEVSLDTGAPGGDLGCERASTYVPVFAQAALAAPLGELSGPVQSSFGFHLLIVSERDAPTRQEYLDDPRAVLSAEEIADLWVDWFTEMLQGADAWVAEDYGVWSPTGIRPPVAEPAATTTG